MAPMRIWRRRIGVAAGTAALVVLTRAYALEPRAIPSGSMRPTLREGDRLLIDKLGYRFGTVSRGDLVVFKAPAAAGGPPGRAYIKRVVGLPGDVLGFAEGRLLVNGQPMAERYTLERVDYPEPDWEALGLPDATVPGSCVFVLGDNRNVSNDSHRWGALPQREIVGRAFFRFWPIHRIGALGGRPEPLAGAAGLTLSSDQEF